MSDHSGQAAPEDERAPELREKERQESIDAILRIQRQRALGYSRPRPRPAESNDGEVKLVDDDLVKFLVQYTNTSDECSEPLRAYIRGLVDRGDKDSEDILMSLEMGLRNWYVRELGIGPRLKNRLLQYELGKSLFPEAFAEDSPAEASDHSHAIAVPSTPILREFYRRPDPGSLTEDQKRWSDMADRIFRVPRLGYDAPVGITAEENRIVGDVVQAIHEYSPKPHDAVQSEAAQRNTSPLATLDSSGAAIGDASSFPPQVMRELDNMQFEFGPASGLVVILSPPKTTGRSRAASSNWLGTLESGGGKDDEERARFIFELDNPVPGERGLSGIAPRLPRLRAVPREPTIGSAFWDHYSELRKSDPPAANAMIDLIRTKIDGFLRSRATETMPIQELHGTTRSQEGVNTLMPDLDNPLDYTVDSWYRGIRQPPLAIRLQNIINFLCDEDIDRCVSFESNCREIEKYLTWLWKVDKLRQVHKAGPSTRRLFYDAAVKLLVHKNFEYHHYGPAKLSNKPPPTVPQPNNRLDWTNANKDLILTNTEAMRPVYNRKAYTRRLFPRPGAIVNTMMKEETQDIPDQKAKAHKEEAIFRPFADDANVFWAAPRNIQLAGRIDPSNPNLAVVESRAYGKFINTLPAWVTGQKQHRSTERLLPDDTLILPNHPESWAKERGARRAGMNQLLQSLQNHEQTVAGPDRSLVALPIPAELESKIRAETSGIQWSPPRLPAKKLPLQLETMPYTCWWRIYTQELGWLRSEAMIECKLKHGADRRWITPPENLIWSGPFVWRQVDTNVQGQQDLLVKAETTSKMLKMTLGREPRELLRTVVSYMRRARTGQFPGGPPPELVLGDDEWYGQGKERQPKFTSSQDLKWLQWLTTDGANLGNYNGGPGIQYSGPDYQTYRIFAKRMQRLLADRSAFSLFKTAESRVEVEQLLGRMNAGANGQTKKVIFKPHKACFFLDRMAQQGMLRFTPDLGCYGVVRRPEVHMTPEMRVRWPASRSFSRYQKPHFPDDLVPYSAIVQRRAAELKDAAGKIIEKDGKPVLRQQLYVAAPNTDRYSQIFRFFANLGFRLGWTLWRLVPERERWKAPHMVPISTNVLLETVRKFDEAAVQVGKTDMDLPRQTRLREDMIAQVQEVVKRANPFDWTKEMTKAEAINLIRDRIVAEGEANLCLLAPARRKEYDKQGRSAVAYVHDISWDWAGVQVRGMRRKFWDMDRWAAHDGYLAKPLRDARASDNVLDWTQSHDPFAHDKTPAKWKRGKLRRYGDEDKTICKPGQAVFPIGDTKHQREVVEDYMTNMAARALGISQRKRTWSDSFAALNPFSSPYSSPPAKRANKRNGDAWLPEVNRKSLPASFDPDSFLKDLEEKRKEEEALSAPRG